MHVKVLISQARAVKLVQFNTANKKRKLLVVVLVEKKVQGKDVRAPIVMVWRSVKEVVGVQQSSDKELFSPQVFGISQRLVVY